jgi:GNAT superfamily N-acetyltransferase
MIRRAGSDDALAIAEVITRSWEVYRGILPDGLIDAQTVEARHEYFREAVQFDAPYATWVATHEGEVVGLAHVGPNRDDDIDQDDVGELWGMYVDPPLFGHGFGRALMAEVERHFAAVGMSAATLWVVRGNRRARRFYEQVGWRPDGAEKLHTTGSGFEIDEVRYRCAFSG